MKRILAPMEGLADFWVRRALTDVGTYDWCVSEFVRVSGELLPPRVFYRWCPELRDGARTRSGTPVHLQLLGSDPVSMADNAAQAVTLGAPGIDLNFGCPA
ncbi:MAG: tRNA-dihydrouridine synthase, partial [Alloalcanivorax venustensis]